MTVRSVRVEDAFDVAAVTAWLRQHADDPAGIEGEPEVQQFSGGASNLTYALTWPDRSLVLRRPPAGKKAKSAHDMGREYRIQKALGPVFPYVPTMVGFCDDPSVIGSEFYVMERLVGLSVGREFPPGVDLTPAQKRQLCLNFVDLLVDLHSLDVEATGLASLGKGEGYVGRQVAGWSDRFRKARTRNVPSYSKVMAWLDEHQPADVRSCLIHNDFKLDNAILSADDPTRPIALLDWEMATVGDPLMDLGGGLAFWVERGDNRLAKAFRRVPTIEEGMLTRDEVLDRYLERSGLTLTREQ